jgi:hypothetical protein
MGTPPPVNHFLFTAFQHLNANRSQGYASVGGIPFEAIAFYGSYWGLAGDALDEFVLIILAVDHHFINVILPMVRERNAPKS